MLSDLDARCDAREETPSHPPLRVAEEHRGLMRKLAEKMLAPVATGAVSSSGP